MALIQDASQRGLDLHWDQAAKQVDPDCSGDALKQQLNKRREKLIVEGAPVTPLTASRTRRTHRTTSHTSDTRDDGTQLSPSKLLRSDPVPDATPKTLALRSTSKRVRESTNESDEEPETKIKRYGDSEDSIDDGAVEDSDGSDWASKKLPKKKTRKVITGQVSKATRMSFSNTKATTAVESVKNNRGDVLGTHSTGESKKFDQSRHDTDDLAHVIEKTAGDNQANTTTPVDTAKLRKSLIVALKSSGGQFINLADHPELTKFDRYNYANLPYPSDLTNEQKKAIYNANPAFALACGNKDDIRLNNFGSPGYENGMPSISQVLNFATNNEYPGFSMISATQSAPIGPEYNVIPSQTLHYQSMINNADPLNLPLDIGQNNGIMPQSQSTSFGYTSPGYFQQGLNSGQLPFRPPSSSIPSTNYNLSGHNAVGTDRMYDFPNARFHTPTFEDEFKVTSESIHGTSVANRFSKIESTGSFGNVESQIGTAIPSTPLRNRTDTGASILDTMSPTDMTMCTPADDPQSPVPKIEANQETQDGTFAKLNSSLDEFSMDNFCQANLDETNWFSFGD